MGEIVERGLKKPIRRFHRDFLGNSGATGRNFAVHSEKVNLLPIERLQRLQMGRRLSMAMVPPLDSGIL